MKTILQALLLWLILSVLTGLIYPLVLWGIGQACFRDQVEGSLIVRRGQVVGSALLAQKTTDPRYFWPRPSAGDFATVPSEASNLAWSSARLAAAVAERRAALGGGDVPADLLTASASGLDPHVSPAAIRWQTERVSAARRLTQVQRQTLDELIARHLEGGQYSPARINVLQLNLALDAAFPTL